MMTATREVLAKFDALAEQRAQEIRQTKDALVISGTTYYVSYAGDDGYLVENCYIY